MVSNTLLVRPPGTTTPQHGEVHCTAETHVPGHVPRSKHFVTEVSLGAMHGLSLEPSLPLPGQLGALNASSPCPAVLFFAGGGAADPRLK